MSETDIYWLKVYQTKTLTNSSVHIISTYCLFNTLKHTFLLRTSCSCYHLNWWGRNKWYILFELYIFWFDFLFAVGYQCPKYKVLSLLLLSYPTYKSLTQKQLNLSSDSQKYFGKSIVSNCHFTTHTIGGELKNQRPLYTLN